MWLLIATYLSLKWPHRALCTYLYSKLDIFWTSQRRPIRPTALSIEQARPMYNTVQYVNCTERGISLVEWRPIYLSLLTAPVTSKRKNTHCWNSWLFDIGSCTLRFWVSPRYSTLTSCSVVSMVSRLAQGSERPHLAIRNFFKVLIFFEPNHNVRRSWAYPNPFSRPFVFELCSRTTNC